jgi:hypothetical protein
MRITSLTLVATCLWLAGCSETASTSAPRPSDPSALTSAQSAKVDRAAAIARQIRANPSAADEVLRQHGMTEQQFEDLMYEIAEAPEMSEAYAKKVGP